MEFPISKQEVVDNLNAIRDVAEQCLVGFVHNIRMNLAQGQYNVNWAQVSISEVRLCLDDNADAVVEVVVGGASDHAFCNLLMVRIAEQMEDVPSDGMVDIIVRSEW